MREARVCDAWRRTAAILAQTANIHRDPKKGRPARPSDFFHFPETPKAKKGLDFDLLRRAFVPPVGS